MKIINTSKWGSIFKGKAGEVKVMIKPPDDLYQVIDDRGFHRNIIVPFGTQDHDSFINEILSSEKDIL